MFKNFLILILPILLLLPGLAYSFDAENKEMSPEAKKFADNADSLQKESNFKGAENSYIRALRYEPENPTLHAKLGIVYHAQFETWLIKNLDASDEDKKTAFDNTVLKAITELEKSVSLDPLDSVARFFLGMEYKRAYELTGYDKTWLDKSIAEFEKSSKLDPENMLSFHMLGVINYSDLKKPDEAKKYFLKVVDMEHKFVEAHLYLANIYIEEKNFVPAKEEIEQIKLFDPKHIEVTKETLDVLEKRIKIDEKAVSAAK